MKRISKHRKTASAQQGGHCFYCKTLMWVDSAERAVFAAARAHLKERHIKWFQETAEHVIAKQNGGTDASANIVAACLFCNSQRHAGGRNHESKRYLRSIRKQCRRGDYPTQRLLKPKR